MTYDICIYSNIMARSTKRHECNICGANFKSAQRLKYHVDHNACAKQNNKKYECNNYNNKFSTKPNLTEHQKFIVTS